MKRILIRVDASPAIGMGHFMRMMALGQLLEDHGYEIHFASIAIPAPAVLLVAKANFTLHQIDGRTPVGSPDDAAGLEAVAVQLAAAWVVLDGSGFGTDYQRSLKKAGLRVLSIDDLGRGHFCSDLVLNQNYGAERLEYSTDRATRTLLGTRYVLLRREFRTADTSRRRWNDPPRNILVSLGGGSLAAAEALPVLARGLARITIPSLRVRLIAGALDTHSSEVRDLAASDPGRFRLIAHTERMSEEMLWADIAICSGGSTVWELLHMQVPFLAVALNQPQVEFLSLLERDGICVNLGSPADLEPGGIRQAVETVLAESSIRDRMLAASSGLIDPLSAERELLDALAAG